MISITKDILNLKNIITCNNLDIFYFNNLINENKYDEHYLIDDNITEYLLENYNNGIYGILNYSIKLSKEEDNYNIEIMPITFYNNTIRNKLTKNINKVLKEDKTGLNDLSIEENYGILSIYEKNDDNIKNLNQIFIIANGYIKYINEIEDDIIENINDFNVITKIYNFEDNKIKCLELIDYDRLDKKINKENNIFYIKKMIDLEIKNKEYIEEINKLIELTQYNNETKDKIICMKYNNNLLDEICNPSNQYIDSIKIFDTLIDFEIINPIINKDNNNYNKLWKIYYGDDIDILIKKYLDNYDLKKIDERVIKHLSNIIEIVLRYNLYLNKKIDKFSITKKLYDIYPQKDKYTTNYSIFKQLSKQLYKSKYHLYLDDNSILSMYIISYLKTVTFNDLIKLIIKEEMIPKII